MTLDQALDAYGVMAVDAMDERTRDEQNLDGWYAVVDDEGINAYFSTLKAALRWRLAEINRVLNG
jgi:hypothetical protein